MAKKSKKKATADPKVTMTRNKYKFTTSWTLKDKNHGAGQELEERLSWSEAAGTFSDIFGNGSTAWSGGGSINSKVIGTSVRKHVVSIDPKNFYPNKNKILHYVMVGVKGKRKSDEDRKYKYTYSWSNMVYYKYLIDPPMKPTVSAEWTESRTNYTKFTVTANEKDIDKGRPFTRIEWQTMLVKNAPSTNGKSYIWSSNATGWATGTSTSKSYTIPDAKTTESVSPTKGTSYTRFVRARAQGIGGDSEWAYNYHVYGIAQEATTGDVEVGKNDGNTVIDIPFDTPSNPSTPIDKGGISLEYSQCVPADGLNPPSNISPTATITRDNTNKADRIYFDTGTALERDQCTFYRIGTKHDANTTYTSWKLYEVGYLKDPTGLSVQTNWTTRKATITATNASSVPDSFLVILCGGMIAGRISSGATSATVDIPSSATEGKIAFGVYAAVGEWREGEKSKGVFPYDGKPIMTSKNTLWQGGTVPQAPKNVTVNRANVKGSVVVGWEWSWEDADSAQIAWSDNPLAWESTDEPNDYTITNLNPSKWYVSDLETGKKWYFRVRLIQTNGDVQTYGAWSDMVDIDLSSAPSKPSLQLSKEVVTEDDMVKAYWAYVSTDDTPQKYAKLCEATITNGVITHGEPFASTDSAQHIDLYPSELGWSNGETHMLCVSVVSGSGIESEEWSDPVPLRIAEKMTATITQDSLETQSIEVNPETHSGNPITFTNPDGVLEFAKLRVDIEPTQDGTGDPSPSNVRPIHGVGEVEVEDVGKNLLDESLMKNQAPWNNIPIYAPAGTVLTASSNKPPNDLLAFFNTGGSGGVSGDSVSTNNSPTVIVPSSGVVYFSQRRLSETESFADYHFQVEKGSTATTYEPYQEPIEITQPLTTTLQPIASDDEPYLMRAMPYGDATNLTENLVGGTVAWNQLINKATFPSTTTYHGITYTNNGDGSVTISGTSDARSNVAIDNIQGVSKGHKYVAYGVPSGSAYNTHYLSILEYNNNTYITSFGVYNLGKIFTIGDTTTRLSIEIVGAQVASYQPNNLKFVPQFFDLTAMFGTTIADAIYAMEQATAGAGVAWFKELFPKSYYPYDAGSLQSVKASGHVTSGFNQFDGTTVNGYIDDADGTLRQSPSSKATDYIRIIPNAEYYIKSEQTSGAWGAWYDADKNYIGGITLYRATDTEASKTKTSPSNAMYARLTLTNGGSGNINTFCINLSDPDKNGTYEPYDGHTYSLPNTELRGILKWVDGKLSYDGDILEPSGKLHKRYKEDDLGGKTWNTRTTGSINKVLSATTESLYLPNGTTPINMVSTYPYQGASGASTLINNVDTSAVGIYNYNGSSAENVIYLVIPKDATPSGRLVYELATATTETVSSFESNQLVSAGGTESYTDTRTVPIPVGHKSTYKTSHVYGGYVDLVSGELVVDRAVVDLGSLSASYNSTWLCWTITSISGAKNASSNTTVVNALSNKMNPVMASGYTSSHSTGTFAQNVNGIWFFDNGSTTELNGTLVYELATPIRTTLTSRELSALVGRNTLTANGNMQIRLAEGITETECLTRLPLTVTVEGAGEGGVTVLAIERSEDFPYVLPDGTDMDGHKGETVVLMSQSGEDQFTIDKDSRMYGMLNDDARYRIVAITKDAYGQSSEEAEKEFLVRWEEQAIEPDGSVEMDGVVAKMTPIAPSGAHSSATCDIYRLSADKPELVYPNAVFGETYVDPYPAIGGGYRFVYKTQYGDYTTEDRTLAMTDVESEFEYDRMIVNFGGDSVELYYNIDEDDDWGKDFQSTQYLGGSIVGDWNPGIERDATITAVVLTPIEEDTVDALRRLAEYSGACHVRTKSGSSYTANVEVKRSKNHEHYDTRYSYSLRITRVDPQGYDGMTLALYEVTE